MTTLEQYRHLGFKPTPQRIAILDYLKQTREHPSAEEIFREVGKKFPSMSPATVYSTLSALKSRGNVLELTMDPEKRRYDADTGPHHHLICLTCKRIVDIPDTFELNPAPASTADFIMIKHHIEFFGICPNCKKKDDITQTKENINVRRS